MLEIIAMEEGHWPAVWRFMEPIFREGASYPTATDISESGAKAYWGEPDKTTYVAQDETGSILGSYYIRPNQPTLGAHICNCGYLVAPEARRRGVASAMCTHSQQEAIKMGYSGMQYNLVVATNTGAVDLWQKMGFDIIGTVPKAFDHKGHGLVDAHIMFKSLAV